MEHVQDVKKGSPSAIHDVCGRTKIAPPAGPLGNRHWKQRAGHSQLSISSKYFTTKGGASACYVNIGNERVQLVLVNPSTNSNTKTIHMNKCNHMIAHGRLAHPPSDEYYDIMLINNMIDGIQSLGAYVTELLVPHVMIARMDTRTHAPSSMCLNASPRDLVGVYIWMLVVPCQ